MAKRVRGTSTRPGQRARLQRSGTTAKPAARPAATPEAAAPKPASLTAEEEARAAELEARIVAEEKAAEDASRASRERGRRVASPEVARSGSIAVRASEEYAYVARDLRRVARIGGGLIAVLLGLWVVITVTGAGPF